MEFFGLHAPLSPHNVRLVCQHLTDCKRQYGYRLPASHRLQKALLVFSHLAGMQRKEWRVCTSLSGILLRWLVEGCAVELSSILTTSPTYQVQLSGPSRGSTLQRLWPKQSVIGEEAGLCSGTAGFHLVRGPEEICLRR